MNYLKGLYVCIAAGVLGLCACDLERIDDMTIGNQNKFNTTVGGSGNDFPYDILANPDGTYIIVGRTQSFTADQNNQAYIIKLDDKGVLVDQNHFGFAADDWAYRVVPVSDGGYVMAGLTSDPVNFNYNIFLVKVNSALDEVWKFSYGSVDSNEIVFGIVPIGTSDFLVGYRSFPFTGGPSTFIRFMRINANGSRVSDQLGTTGMLSVQDMIKTSDGMIAVCGSDFSSNGTAAYVAKFDGSGGLIWDQSFPESNANYSPGYGIVEMSDGSLTMAGSDLGSSDHDFLLLSYTQIGMKLMDEAWGGANADELLAVTRSQDDEVVCMGYSSSFSSKTEIYVSKRKRTDGTEIWSKNFGESWVIAGAITLCPDGGFVLCAGQNAANADIIVVKMDQNGNYE